MLLIAASAEARTIEVLEELVQAFPAVDRVKLVGPVEGASTEALAKAWLHPRRPDLKKIEVGLRRALGTRSSIATETVPLDVVAAIAAAERFEASEADIANATRSMEVDALFAVQTDLGFDGLTIRAELLGGSARTSVFVYQHEVFVPDRMSPLTTWNLRALGVYLLVALVLLRKLLRGRATLVVDLVQDDVDKEAVWSVLLWKNAQGRSENTAKPAHSILAAVASNTFKGIAPRTWHVGVRRVLRAADGSEVLSNHFRERPVELKRGKPTRIRMRLSRECIPIEVKVLLAGDPVEQAMVGLHGTRRSTSYARDGIARIEVEKGTHGVLVGHGDRVLRHDVEVNSPAKYTVEFDIDSDEGLVFSGCEAAVEPYVNGDLEAAVHALRNSQCDEAANLLQAELHRDRGETSEAAKLMASAGLVREAADLTAGAAAGSADGNLAAELYEQAGDWNEAGEIHERSAAFEAAMHAYEKAENWPKAVACASQAGDRDALVRILENSGERVQAARLALELDDAERAIRCLQKVGLNEASFGESCTMLAELFLQRGKPELALAKLEEAAQTLGSDHSLELREQIGQLFESQGRLDDAVDTYEGILKRDLHFPGMEERVSALREQMRGPGVGNQPSTAIGSSESRYEILGEIGRGAMGVVYKAKDRRLERIVAMKVLPDNLKEHPLAVRLFLREAKAAAALNHPNIVTVHDADQEGDVYYLTMEFLEGVPIDQLLAKPGRKLALPVVARMGLGTAEGLQCAFEHRIVHRDIKPSNLFLTKTRQVKIMDFGLAKIVEEVRKQASVIGGTPNYMAPEQTLGEATDHRADLYALGVTLYQLATGVLPFREGDLAYHHRHTPPPDPRESRDDIPEAMAELVLHLMAKSPDDRPATPAEVIQRLKPLAG